jgi:hypothetical protein
MLLSWRKSHHIIAHRKTPMHATGIRRFVWLPRSFAGGASGSRA